MPISFNNFVSFFTWKKTLGLLVLKERIQSDRYGMETVQERSFTSYPSIQSDRYGMETSVVLVSPYVVDSIGPIRNGNSELWYPPLNTTDSIGPIRNGNVGVNCLCE